MLQNFFIKTKRSAAITFIITADLYFLKNQTQFLFLLHL